MRNSVHFSGSRLKVPFLLAIAAVVALSVTLAQATEYLVRSDGAVSVLSGAVKVSYNQPGQRGSGPVLVEAGYSFNPASWTVVPTTPDYLQNIIADINTVRTAAVAFRVSDRGTVVVKPTTVRTPVVPGGPAPGGPGPAGD
jgi:hypothetical protein